MRDIGRIAAALSLLFASSAAFAGPEQLDQLEPGQGEWQTEYFGTFGKGGEREHAIEAMYGVSDRLALGVEVEAEFGEDALAFETVGLKALYRLSDAEAAIALGLQVQLGFDEDAELAEAEARLIAEHQSATWWAQGNLMLRRSREDGSASTGLAYAWSAQRAVTDFAWLGFEGSGQTAPIANEGRAESEHGHFAGPSLTFDWEPAEELEVEMGFAYLHRVAGDGPKGSGRFFVQFSF